MLYVSPPGTPRRVTDVPVEEYGNKRRRAEKSLPTADAPNPLIPSSSRSSSTSEESLLFASTRTSRSGSSSLSAASQIDDEEIERAHISSNVATRAPCLLIRSMKQGWGRAFELHNDWPRPRILEPDEVLVEHRAIGLNPVDYKSVLYNFGVPDSPWVLGRDIAGVVVGVGHDVSDCKIGQRVWTCADARDIRAGAYQSFSVCRSVHLSPLPDKTTDSQAATLGTGLVTAAIAAYWFFNWPRAHCVAKDASSFMPRTRSIEKRMSRHEEQKPWLLIYGGGAITGIYMAQLARLSGFRTVAVASPANFEYLQSSSVGVTACIDRYLDPREIVATASAITTADGGSGVSYVLDCVGSKTASLCQEIATKSRSRGALQSTDSRAVHAVEMICLAGNPKRPRDEDEENKAKGIDTVIHRISFSTTFYGDDVFAKGVMSDLAALLEAGSLTPARSEVLADGLAGVRRGLESLRDNAAPRAKKLVVHIADTPHAHHTNLGVRAETCWNGVA